MVQVEQAVGHINRAQTLLNLISDNPPEAPFSPETIADVCRVSVEILNSAKALIKPDA